MQLHYKLGGPNLKFSLFFKMVFSYIPFKSKYNGGLVLQKSGDLPKGNSPFLVFSSFLHLVGIL